MVKIRKLEDKVQHTVLQVFNSCAVDATTDCSIDRQWVKIVLLCALVAIICSIDRTAMSVAILPMSKQYGWSDSVKGSISSSFNIGHMITNLYGGYLAATMPPKHVLTAGVIVWSLFTLLTPVAAATSWLPVVLVTRAVMGLGEGVAFPTMQAIVKGWVPLEKRTRSISLIFSGHQIGSILSLLISPLIIASWGVAAMFYVYGAAGFLWLTLWDPVMTIHPTLPGTGGDKPVVPVRLRDLPWRAFFSSKCFWAILVAHSTFGIGYNMCIAWLPTYYNQEYGVDLKQSAFLSILPWLVMAAGTNASGWVADTLINSKVLSTTKTRKSMQLIGNLGPGLCLAYLAWAPQKGYIFEALALLTLAMGTLGFQSGGFASNHQDISTRYASVLFGITNACASLAGSIFVYLVGVILDQTRSWSLVFQLVALVNFAAAAMYTTCATSEPLFD